MVCCWCVQNCTFLSYTYTQVAHARALSLLSHTQDTHTHTHTRQRETRKHTQRQNTHTHDTHTCTPARPLARTPARLHARTHARARARTHTKRRAGKGTWSDFISWMSSGMTWMRFWLMLNLVSEVARWLSFHNSWSGICVYKFMLRSSSLRLVSTDRSHGKFVSLQHDPHRQSRRGLPCAGLSRARVHALRPQSCYVMCAAGDRGSVQAWRGGAATRGRDLLRRRSIVLMSTSISSSSLPGGPALPVPICKPAGGRRSAHRGGASRQAGAHARRGRGGAGRGRAPRLLGPAAPLRRTWLEKSFLLDLPPIA